jgi:hypothetical protein
MKAKDLKKGQIIKYKDKIWRVEYVERDAIGLYSSTKTNAFKARGFTKVNRKEISPNETVELRESRMKLKNLIKEDTQYSPANCKTLEDIKQGLKQLKSKNYNNIITDVSLRAYEIRAKQLHINFDIQTYFKKL